jgi:hypothetical protein
MNPPDVFFRLRYQLLGGHVHCRLFTAPRREGTFAKAGDLVFSVREWPTVRTALELVIEILPEDR